MAPSGHSVRHQIFCPQINAAPITNTTKIISIPTPKIITRIKAKTGDAVLFIGTDKISDNTNTIANATNGNVRVCKTFLRLIGMSSNKKFSGQI